jgi:hypothetical protein
VFWDLGNKIVTGITAEKFVCNIFIGAVKIIGNYRKACGLRDNGIERFCFAQQKGRVLANKQQQNTCHKVKPIFQNTYSTVATVGRRKGE